MNSRVRHGGPSCSAIAWIAMMFGCRRWATVRASARNRSTCSPGGVLGLDHRLDRDDAAELLVAGLVDDSHAPAPDLADDVVTRNCRDWFTGSLATSRSRGRNSHDGVEIFQLADPVAQPLEQGRVDAAERLERGLLAPPVFVIPLPELARQAPSDLVARVPWSWAEPVVNVRRRAGI